MRELLRKLRLLGVIWLVYLDLVLIRHRRLPDQIAHLKSGSRHRERVPPLRLSSAIHRGLRFGPLTPRCLPKALVMFRLLYQQGDEPELVIGLPDKASNHRAHAWIEIDGVDVGPPPGRGRREPLARYR